jgi:hemerythrin-like domain-containing protein
MADVFTVLADEAITQEQQARCVLAELDKLEADDARFEALLSAFTQAARRHIEFEETQVWPGLHAVPARRGGTGTRPQDHRR